MEGERDVTLAVGAYDASVACLSFNPEKGLQRRFRCSGHSGSVRAVAIHGQWLATGSTDETIRLYNLRDCSEIGSLVHHEGSITWLEFSGDQMYSASEDGNIAVWRTGTWECTKTLTGHKGPVKCLCVHPSGKLALSVGRDRILRTWDLSTGIAVFRQKLKEVAQQVKLSDCAKYYALSYKVTIDLYSVQSGALSQPSVLATPSLPSSLFQMR
ncbi:p21-activated protein kinase-interacting protein 1-like [Geodia barretti]|uniref:P21-activated protein kinase-interacting protein 1-like n=1 Tax=Geodia barretti TaxID=519541 RepID=A0AA35SZG9_GEOBA|nr:p21-activated protein kinase-interacting protein 1-like [Geodia barretti]